MMFPFVCRIPDFVKHRGREGEIGFQQAQRYMISLIRTHSFYNHTFCHDCKKMKESLHEYEMI